MKTFLALTILILLLTQLHFPGSRLTTAANQFGVASAATEEIPTIDFCEMVKNPKLYFDKAVRLTATFEQATEAQYLSDDKCPLSHDDQIGVGYATVSEEQNAARRNIISKLRLAEYGGRARVMATGMLRNSSRRAFAWYQYRFDIISVEELSHVIVPYEGELRGGRTYVAAVRGDSSDGLALVIPVRIPEHQAARIEWTNLSEFPALVQLQSSPREQRIVFSVISDEIKQMTERRWNRTLRCKIISIAS
jgi:hypothetical protein